jgi:hypothetical protein
MADLRLAIIVLAACTDAGAQTSGASPVKPPAGWTAQPAIVAAAKQALGKTAIDSLEAFAEPRMGCYAIWMGLRSAGDAQELGAQVMKGLDKVAVKNVVKPSAETGVMSLTFEKAPFEGRLQARLAPGSIKALACWWSKREPIACSQACALLVGGMP